MALSSLPLSKSFSLDSQSGDSEVSGHQKACACLVWLQLVVQLWFVLSSQSPKYVYPGLGSFQLFKGTSNYQRYLLFGQSQYDIIG